MAQNLEFTLPPPTISFEEATCRWEAMAYLDKMHIVGVQITMGRKFTKDELCRLIEYGVPLGRRDATPPGVRT